MPFTSCPDARDGFAEAARWFVQAVGSFTERDAPSLGQWTGRDLVGHTSRALLTVENYLAQPARAVDVESPQQYFDLIFAASGDENAVAQRGRDAGRVLGADPAAAVANIAIRVLDLTARSTGNEIVGSPVGGMRLVDYLATRTFELTVHTVDLTVATGSIQDPPPIAAAQALRLIADLAVSSGRAGPLLRAATGRPDALPRGFTVLGG